jgi:hypothetical protein
VRVGGQKDDRHKKRQCSHDTQHRHALTGHFYRTHASEECSFSTGAVFDISGGVSVMA